MDKEKLIKPPILPAKEDPREIQESLSLGASIIISILIISFLIPGSFTIFSITLGFPRLVLVIAIIPSLFLLFRNSRFKINIVDILVLSYASWTFISIIVNHGLHEIQFGGLQVVESLGAYSLGRLMFLNIDGYRFFWRIFGYCTIIILPFCLYELFTGQLVLNQIFAQLIDTFPDATQYYSGSNSSRLGLDRVQGNMEHPILFGIFWGFGLLHFISAFNSQTARIFFMSCCLILVGSSLSSGAYLIVMIQLSLLAWGIVTRERWLLLAALGSMVFIIVEILSDRPALVALSTRLAFNSDTAYARILIFEYGIKNVWENPIFGLGLNDWARPTWLSSSVDNQWLLVAMRAGIPAFILQMSIFMAMILLLLRRMDLGARATLYRRNFLISFSALFISLGTVAVWSGTQSFLWLLVAMGVSIALSPSATKGETLAHATTTGHNSYTRFPPKFTRQRKS